MFEKFNDKIETIEYVFNAHPKLFYKLIWLTFLTNMVAWIYYLGLPWLMNLQVFNTYPFYSFISDNFDLLRKGGVLLVLAIVIYGISDFIDLYNELKMRKY